jgi:signal transduction histidine kinase
LSRSIPASGNFDGEPDDALAARAAYLQTVAALFARDRVLSVASHDLRSPLNGIHSWIYVLESKVGQAEPTIARALAGLRTGVEQQVRIIEDVIDATRAQSKALPLDKMMLDVERIVAHVVQCLDATFARERATAIEVRWPPSRISIVADGARIAQALWAALAYAVDASRPGGTVSMENVFEDGVWRASIRFQPSDALTNPDLPHAFEPFLRGTTPVQGTDGMPLALSVTQRVVLAHGGKSSAASGTDGFTSIALTLPERG